MTTAVNAAANPALANQMAQEAMQVSFQEEVGQATEIVIPSLPDTTVELPGGFYTPFDGTLDTTAEVRELTGADEEVIVKVTDPAKALLMILDKATVSVGDKPATKDLLASLLSGDREMLLLAIRKATFGTKVTLESGCDRCGENRTFEIDLDTDVKIKKLEDPINDRTFTLKIKAGTVKIDLPTGDSQIKIINATNKNVAELDTLLLNSCVVELNDMPVVGQSQVRNLGIKDRRDILEEIAKRNPGPQLSEIKKACDTCGLEVELPLTLADLFRS